MKKITDKSSMSDLPRTKKNRMQDGLATILREQIVSGVFKVGDFLPPERELSKHYKVSSRVVRECLAALEAEGLILRQQGRGTLVAEREQNAQGSVQKNIAVIFLQRMKDLSTIEFFDSLQNTFQRGGYGTTIFVSDCDPEKEAEIVGRLVNEGVSGIVLFTAHSSGSFAHLKAAQDAGVKIALFDHFFPGFETNFAGIDDREGAYDATSHLLHAGCERMLFVRSSVDWTTHSLRQKGFEDAMAKLAPGMPFTVLEVSFENMKEDLEVGLADLIPAVGRKLGVVCWSDAAALCATSCFQAQGVSIPQDVAVIGFSDDLDSAIAPVPLTTMKIPREDLARLLAYSMLDQLRDPKLAPQHVTLAPHLVIRESCGLYRPINSLAKNASN